MLTWSGDQERMASIMEAVLPPQMTVFFMPDSNCYNEDQDATNAASCYAEPIPLADLMGLWGGAAEVHIPGVPKANRGSNAWLVGPQKTRDGRAIPANDMHLSLGIPNIWYRAELHYRDVMLAGLTIPGVPSRS